MALRPEHLSREHFPNFLRRSDSVPLMLHEGKKKQGRRKRDDEAERRAKKRDGK